MTTIDRPFLLAAARAWWAKTMGGDIRAIDIGGDGRVKVAWRDAQESGHYTLPVDFLDALAQPPVGLRAGLQEIVDAADRLSRLGTADLYREGYVAAFRDARSMALKALNQGDKT
jgi:hypothetical protein